MGNLSLKGQAQVFYSFHHANLSHTRWNCIHALVRNLHISFFTFAFDTVVLVVIADLFLMLAVELLLVRYHQTSSMMFFPRLAFSFTAVCLLIYSIITYRYLCSLTLLLLQNFVVSLFNSCTSKCIYHNQLCSTSNQTKILVSHTDVTVRSCL